MLASGFRDISDHARTAIVLLGLALLATTSFTIAPPDRGHIDELYWIGSAYYWELLKQPAVGSREDWQLLPARENPPVARYAIGLAINLAGHRVADLDLLANFYLRFANIPRAWGDDDDSQRERMAVAERGSPELIAGYSSGRVPGIDPRFLWPARRLMLVLAIVTAWLLFFIGSQAGGATAGAVAGCLFLVHPISLAAYTFAMSDMVAICFTTAAIGAALLCVRDSPTWRVSLLFAGLSGMLLGLACSAKLNALVGAAAIGGFSVILTSRGWIAPPAASRLWWAAPSLAAGVLLAMIVFVAVNPTLRADPFTGIVDLFAEHRHSVAIQSAFTGVPPLAGIMAKTRAVARLVGVWSPLFLLPAGMAISLIPAIVRGGAATAVIGIWWFAAFVMVTAWIPSATDRYAMPLVPPSVLVMGVLIASATRFLTRYSGRR